GRSRRDARRSVRGRVCVDRPSGAAHGSADLTRAGMFDPQILQLAETVLAEARAKGLKIATAESCTGGLVAGALTEIAGSSDVFVEGFVTYSNEAKMATLGVVVDTLDKFGA